MSASVYAPLYPYICIDLLRQPSDNRGVEFSMNNTSSVPVDEDLEKINPQALGKIGQALREHFARYPDLLLDRPKVEMHRPDREDL